MNQFWCPKRSALFKQTAMKRTYFAKNEKNGEVGKIMMWGKRGKYYVEVKYSCTVIG